MTDDPLDVVNRFAVTLMALLIAFAALSAVLLAWGAADGSIERLRDLAGWLEDHNTRDGRVILTLFAAIAVLLMTVAVIVEVTPSPTQLMRVRNVKAGDATITTAEIAARAEEECLAVAHVADCRAVVAVRGRGVEIVLDLQVDAGADLEQAANEACRRVHELVEQRIGVPLAARPRARLRYRELVLRDGMGRARELTGWERPESNEGDA